MAERAVRRQTPEVGAGCLNWACPDLCGGRGVTRVPTAITYAHTHDGQRSMPRYRPDIRAQLTGSFANAERRFIVLPRGEQSVAR